MAAMAIDVKEFCLSTLNCSSVHCSNSNSASQSPTPKVVPGAALPWQQLRRKGLQISSDKWNHEEEYWNECHKCSLRKKIEAWWMHIFLPVMFFCKRLVWWKQIIVFIKLGSDLCLWDGRKLGKVSCGTVNPASNANCSACGSRHSWVCHGCSSTASVFWNPLWFYAINSSVVSGC